LKTNENGDDHQPLKKYFSQKAGNSSIVQESRRIDQISGLSTEMSSATLSSISVEEELANAGIVFSFHKVLGIGRFSCVYDGKTFARS
jgi:hypothetical protein